VSKTKFIERRFENMFWPDIFFALCTCFCSYFLNILRWNAQIFLNICFPQQKVFPKSLWNEIKSFLLKNLGTYTVHSRNDHSSNDQSPNDQFPKVTILRTTILPKCQVLVNPYTYWLIQWPLEKLEHCRGFIAFGDWLFGERLFKK
jgi:hypothetical protein